MVALDKALMSDFRCPPDGYTSEIGLRVEPWKRVLVQLDPPAYLLLPFDYGLRARITITRSE